MLGYIGVCTLVKPIKDLISSKSTAYFVYSQVLLNQIIENLRIGGA